MAHKNKENWNPYSKGIKKKKKSTLEKKKSSVPIKTYSFHETDDRIADIFRNHGLEHFPHNKRQILTQFYLLLMESQKSENFTRLTTLKDVAIKHFIDSLWINEITTLTFPLLDLGTGAGFPGIPLKILYPQKKIILAEGVQKRVLFLKHTRETLQLKELDIIGKNIDQDFFYPVNGVITRAVEEIKNTLSHIAQCLQTKGKVYFMKGPNVDPEILRAEKEWKKYFELVEDISYKIPQTSHKRRLLVYQKMNNTQGL